MIVIFAVAFFVSLAGSASAITLYSPFCTNACQTTKGPGSYGKSASDVRYRDGWHWKPLPYDRPNNSGRPRSSTKKTTAS